MCLSCRHQRKLKKRWALMILPCFVHNHSLNVFQAILQALEASSELFTQAFSLYYPWFDIMWCWTSIVHKSAMYIHNGKKVSLLFKTAIMWPKYCGRGTSQSPPICNVIKISKWTELMDLRCNITELLEMQYHWTIMLIIHVYTCT